MCDLCVWEGGGVYIVISEGGAACRRWGEMLLLGEMGYWIL